MKPEILAPAGNPLSLKAAVEAGADSVYFGSGWNARLRARNFSLDEIKKAISYCHKNSVKAYITVNTLIFEDELQTVADYLSYIYEHGADAVIVQDLGVARIVKELGSDMKLHASTQLSVHNSESAKLLKQIGFDRIVLARELNIDQIKKIKQTGIETEVFVHGAMCYSYSGKCLWSYAQTGRSGNRGVCAQICRFPWRMEIQEKDGTKYLKGYLTSMKDLNLLSKIDDIAEAGIDCVKIEGRLKGPEYIYETVKRYRDKVEGKQVSNFEPGPRGFTTGYLFRDGRLINPNSQMFSGEYIGRVERRTRYGAEVYLEKELKSGDKIRTSSSQKPIVVYRMYKQDKEIERGTGKCILKIKTLREGDRLYRIKKSEDNDKYTDENFLDGIQAEERRKTKHVSIDNNLLKKEIKKAGMNSLEKYELIYIDEYEDIKSKISDRSREKDKGQKEAAFVIPLHTFDEKTIKIISSAGKKVFIDMPRVIFDDEMKDVERKAMEIKEKIKEYGNDLEVGLMISEISYLSDSLCFSDFPLCLSHYANVTNSYAAVEWMRLSKHRIRGISGSIEMQKDDFQRLGFMEYRGKRLEVVISQNNLFEEYGIKNPKKVELIDPRGNKYRVVLRNGRTIIFSPSSFSE
jgi:collagenase-like PrtC family protease